MEDEYFCPNCGAILNDQPGFDPDEGDWTCTSCGKCLYGDDVYDGDLYDGVMWHCDNCGALLNKQSGFSDYCSSWTCTECGHSNPISEDEIYESEEEYQKQKESNSGSGFFDTFATSFKNYVESSDEDEKDEEYEEVEVETEQERKERLKREAQEEEERRKQQAEEQRIREEEERVRKEKKKEKRKKRHAWYKKHWRGMIITVLVLAVAILGSYAYYQYSKLTPIGISSAEAIGSDYESVERRLESSGFESVRTVALEDLAISEIEQEGLVSEMVVDGATSFEEDDTFAKDVSIIISYHTLTEVAAPIASKDAKGENYEDIIKQFEDAGYVNVKTEIVYDLITGWIVSDGEVESVEIGNNSDFEEGLKNRPDVEVKITYHTFKKNKE